MKNQSRPGEGGSDSDWVGAGTRLPDVPCYLVLLVGRNGNTLRRPYLSLHSAQQAMERAQKRGQDQDCRLILCALNACRR
jgi:hypothetical protein